MAAIALVCFATKSHWLTVDVPQFAIAVKLSPQAEGRLRGTPITVAAYFDGDPLPGQGTYSAPFRDVYLGSIKRPVAQHGVATFSKVKIPRSDWERLADKNYYVTINTYSGGPADKNLLACNDPINQRIETLRGKTIDVFCHLSEEVF